MSDERDGLSHEENESAASADGERPSYGDPSASGDEREYGATAEIKDSPLSGQGFGEPEQVAPTFSNRTEVLSFTGDAVALAAKVSEEMRDAGEASSPDASAAAPPAGGATGSPAAGGYSADIRFNPPQRPKQNKTPFYIGGAIFALLFGLLAMNLVAGWRCGSQGKQAANAWSNYIYQARDMAGGIMTDQRSAWPRPNGPAYTYREISESEADALHLQTALRNKDWETAGRVLRGMTFVERPNFREAHAATQEVVDSCW